MSNNSLSNMPHNTKDMGVVPLIFINNKIRKSGNTQVYHFMESAKYNGSAAVPSMQSSPFSVVF